MQLRAFIIISMLLKHIIVKYLLWHELTRRGYIMP